MHAMDEHHCWDFFSLLGESCFMHGRIYPSPSNHIQRNSHSAPRTTMLSLHSACPAWVNDRKGQRAKILGPDARGPGLNDANLV